MFRCLSIKGFRGLKSLTVEGLDRFNLFLGRNNVGKTALLESIFLIAGPINPDLPLRLGVLRGIEQFRINPEELWGWLFHNKNLKREIVIELESEACKRRSLTIGLGERKEVRYKNLPKKQSRSNGSLATASTEIKPTELLLRYRNENNAKFESKAYVAENSIKYEHSKTLSVPLSVFVLARGGSSPDNPERFSALQEVGKENEILPALQIVEPRLKRLSILVTAAGPTIHGDIGIDRLLPLQMMGDGLGRLMTLLLSIISSENGFVMVDEIDSGLHFSVMANVWSAIAKITREKNVQFFATTHSWECLKAAHESFSQSAMYDFRLHRLDRVDDLVTSTTYDREMIETALSSGMELR